jgi:hypothetical protein
MSEPPASAPAPPPTLEQRMASITRQLQGLLSNTLRSVEHLRSKLTTDEQEQIKARPNEPRLLWATMTSLGGSSA